MSAARPHPALSLRALRERVRFGGFLFHDTMCRERRRFSLSLRERAGVRARVCKGLSKCERRERL
jgi:hypothetical protein